MSLANVSIVGNLVRPPEQMHFVSGKVKTTFTVAVNGFGKPTRGGDTADFYRVETWGKLAELAGKYLEKGNQIAVSGRLLFDRFVDQQGKNRVVPVVEANQLSLPPRPRSDKSTDQNIEMTAAENMDLAAGTADDQDKQGVPLSGHLVLEIDEQEISSPDNENITVAADFKAIGIDEKTKPRARRQAVLSS